MCVVEWIFGGAGLLLSCAPLPSKNNRLDCREEPTDSAGCCQDSVGILWGQTLARRRFWSDLGENVGNVGFA